MKGEYDRSIGRAESRNHQRFVWHLSFAFFYPFVTLLRFLTVAPPPGTALLAACDPPKPRLVSYPRSGTADAGVHGERLRAVCGRYRSPCRVEVGGRPIARFLLRDADICSARSGTRARGPRQGGHVFRDRLQLRQERRVKRGGRETDGFEIANGTDIGQVRRDRGEVRYPKRNSFVSKNDDRGCLLRRDRAVVACVDGFNPTRAATCHDVTRIPEP